MFNLFTSIWLKNEFAKTMASSLHNQKKNFSIDQTISND